MMHNLMGKPKAYLVTLRFVILFIFISLFLVTMGIIIITTSARFADTLSYTSQLLMQYTSNSIFHEVTEKMRPLGKEADFAAHLIQQGVLPQDQAHLIPYTMLIVKSSPLIQGAHYGDENGNYIAAIKEPDGTISTEIFQHNAKLSSYVILKRDLKDQIIQKIVSSNLSYDPRSRPWYIDVKKTKRASWTDVFVFQPQPLLGITAVAPFFNQQGQFAGAFGVDITLNYLSQFMTRQYISPHGYAFIMTETGNIIAFPKKSPFTDLSAHPNQVLNVHQMQLPLISQSIDLYRANQQQRFTMNYHGMPYLISYQSIPDFSAHGWLIGVVIPKTDFTGQLQKLYVITLTISFGILIIAIMLMSKLISRIVKPIHSLAEETKKIKEFNLDDGIHITSRIQEIVYLRNAIQSMKNGLKIFQKYVPKTLVRQLIATGQDVRIGGVKENLTVFFSDIKNFTTIAENMDPNQLMEQTCTYFDALSTIISHEEGTIDKYIGDSIMAFWGAPIPVEHPTIRAAAAAVQCQQKIAELNAAWEKQDKPPFITRIGIHLGDAIVGNVGSSSRLNYTALGDTINIASRLEQMNKYYKTKIIVSDVVYDIIKDQFILRMIDYVVLKGRTKSNYIYELISDEMSNVPFDVVHYQTIFSEGFTAYQHQHWDLALSHFKKCLGIYPADTIAPIFIMRCEHFKSHPPAADWNGVFKIDL